MELASSLLQADEVKHLQRLLVVLDTPNDASYTQAFYDAVRSRHSSYLPLLSLHAICNKRSRPWPALELLRLFWTCWRQLPEAAKASQDQRAHGLIRKALALCNNSFSSIADLLHPSSPQAALINPDNGLTINHITLARLISNFSLPIANRHSSTKPVVAISLPNGTLLAVAILSTATYYTAAPVAHGSGVGAEQFKKDVLQSGSNFVLASAADVDRLGIRDAWLQQAGIKVLLVELSDRSELVYKDLDRRRIDTTTWPSPRPNRAGDIAILLFTSGTSGTKKLVPLHVETLVTGAAMVQSSWGLTASSRCLNQMPLNHVGGIVRNLFAPLFSAGSVICCTSFDPQAFWDIVEDHQPTWYYAAPTMHQCILEAGADRPESVAKSQIKLICNAAGALLPSLAVQLRDTFSRPGLQCTVLPSYGMTECMPITTPPLDYCLDKPGTSGVSIGPEIAVLDDDDRLVRPGKIGRIAVRGAPIFAGYLKDGQLDRSCFNRDGWFDTGDMGYLDAEGYLYLTSRSKEVINRGGELISPFEVEEAVLAAAKDPKSCLYGTVSRALAFSTKHDLLQEVVGLLVEVPAEKKRPCLKMIQEGVKSSLAAVKTPVVIVYMNGIPTNNNKVLRIQLGERMHLPILSDATPQSQRYYEAICPPPNTPLSTSIKSRPLPLSYRQLHASCCSCIPPKLDFHIRAVASEAHPELWLAPKPQASIDVLWSEDIAKRLRLRFTASLDGYCVPSKIEYLDKPFTRNDDGTIDEQSLRKDEPIAQQGSAWGGIDQTETKISIAFAETLGVPAHTLNASSHFFELGGDSLKAGRLLSALRKSFKIRLTIENLFTASTVGALAQVINDKVPASTPQTRDEPRGHAAKSLPGCAKTKSSTNPFLLAVQLLPILVIAPMRRALSWTFFIYSFAFSQRLPTSDSLPGRFFNLVLSLLLGKIFAETVAPIVAVLCKWLIIGRYKEGLYPIWGLYHTRWWLVEKIIAIGGAGVYKHTGFTLRLYYRLLGVKVGKRVVIDKTAKLGEYDLLTIEDGAVLDPASTVRAFAAERNTSFYLGKVRIGMNASLGIASIVAAGTSVPPNACIGPNSSSWEINDAAEGNRDLSPSKITQPGWTITYLLGLPLVVITSFVGALPWMCGLFPLILTEPKQDSSDLVRDTIIWFSGVQRVIWHYIALALHAGLGPIFFFFAVLAVKRCLDAACGGPLQPASSGRSQLDLLRMLLMRTLMPDRQFHKLTGLFGTHYEPTSVFARLLGARVGKHIYWPGKGPDTQDWDMLEVGDNVVFGSRAYIITADGYGTAKVRVGDGSMIADRVVLLPGSDIGKKTVMGSGALARRDKQYPSETTWVGSKANDSICLKAQVATTALEPVLGARHRQYRDTIDGQVSIYNYYMNASEVSLPRTPHDSRLSSMYDLDPYYEDMLSKEKATTTVTEIPVEAEQELESSPFARAFYEGRASYRLWNQVIITCYSVLITVVTTVFWNIHSISAIQIVAWIFRHPTWRSFLQLGATRPLMIYLLFSCLIACIMALQIVVALGFVIAAKWTLMGRRLPGNYDWDKSPYCQRWQLFLKIESLRQQCYGGNGILGLLTSTHWIVLYFRALGATIGKDCALFVSGTPSLYFTEPDLLTLGDRVTVDNASLVGHINTRGKFDLNPLFVGDRSVLRSGSRLLSGAKMEADSCLLEHTLVMAGDVVEAESARQGWPSEEFESNRLPTLRVEYHWVRA